MTPRSSPASPSASASTAWPWSATAWTTSASSTRTTSASSASSRDRAMKILVSWLRDFVELPADARAIGEALTGAGLAVDGIERRGDDAVLDLDITTNRVDAMNVYGVAR